MTLLTDKSANVSSSIELLLQKRWSPRAFSEQMVEPEKLCILFEAARWAASSFNEQPWSFIVATKDNRDRYDRLLSCLAEFNQLWAQSAPILMLSVAKLSFEKNGKENRHAFYDVGSALANLAIQATALDMFIHQMAGFDVEKARSLFDIPQGYEPVTAIAVGYPGDSQTLPEKLYQREVAPRTRKPLSNFVFTDSWGKTLPLVVNYKNEQRC